MSEGMQGFGNLQAEFAVGSVTGVRWWNLDLAGDRIELKGMRDKWIPGENTAQCPGSHAIPPHARCTCPAAQLACEVPCECGRCGCGFWAYWLLDEVPGAALFPMPVLGVIEGYGTTTIGQKGFRCARARIAGLHLPRVTDRRPLQFRHAAPRWFPLIRQMTDMGEIAAIALLEGVLGKTYGVPVYPDMEALLASHPTTTDYIA